MGSKLSRKPSYTNAQGHFVTKAPRPSFPRTNCRWREATVIPINFGSFPAYTTVGREGSSNVHLDDVPRSV